MSLLGTGPAVIMAVAWLMPLTALIFLPGIFG